MESLKKLETHLAQRIEELQDRKKAGKKIVGFIPGFTPEELIDASGAIPLALIRGGESIPIAASLSYTPRFLDTYARAQIGYWASGEDPTYQMMDLLVVAAIDDNMKAIPDILQYYTNLDVLNIGLPHQKTDLAINYFYKQLDLMKKRLEELVGKSISDNDLKKSIDLYNRIRSALSKVNATRKSKNPPISGKEFARLNHASYYGDAATIVDILESLAKELGDKEGKEVKGPRIMIIGSTLAMGDYKIYDLIENTGAVVVFEECCEGIRQYWEDVNPNGDLLSSLVDKYLTRRNPSPPAFKPPEGRFEFLLNKIRELNVAGIVWYELLYREAYDIDAFIFSRVLDKELGIPMLLLQSEYDDSENIIFRTRVEAFVESLERRK